MLFNSLSSLVWGRFIYNIYIYVFLTMPNTAPSWHGAQHSSQIKVHLLAGTAYINSISKGKTYANFSICKVIFKWHQIMNKHEKPFWFTIEMVWTWGALQPCVILESTNQIFEDLWAASQVWRVSWWDYLFTLSLSPFDWAAPQTMWW